MRRFCKLFWGDGVAAINTVTFGRATASTRSGMAAAVLAMIAGMAGGAAGWAEERSATGRGVIEEVVVTARKREEAAQDVPVAITAITTELKRASIRNLQDLNGLAPNVRIDADAGRNNGASVSIRGISPTRVDDNSFDAPIAVMIDNIYLGSLGGQLLENFDLERVEILRGPQGTLFGRNTVGGVVNVIRSRPTGEFGARGKVTVGRYDTREVRAVLNAPVIQDKLAAKAFFTSIQNDGYIGNTFLDRRQPEKDYQNFGLTLLATPFDRLEALFTIERFDDHSQIGASLTNFNVAPGVVPPPADPAREPDLSGGLLACNAGFTPCRTDLSIPDTISTDITNPASTEVTAYTLNTTFDINDALRIVSVTGYRDMEENRIFDFDGTSARYIDISRLNDFRQFSQELRLEGVVGDFSFVSGVYYWNSEFAQDWVTGGSFWSSLVPALIGDGVTPNPVLQACFAGLLGQLACDSGAPAAGLGPNFVQLLFETQETTAKAFFGQVDWNVAEKWTLTAGIRWTGEEKDFIAGQAYLAPENRAGVFNFPAFADLGNSWKEVSLKGGVAYQWNDDVLMYFSYAEGFHSGGFFGVNQNVSDFERDQYDPETARTYELGLKSQWFDRRVQFNLALFYNDFQDKQEQSIQVDPSTRTVATVFDNVASAIYKGVEGELQWAANEYVNLFASVGYLDAEYDKFSTDITPNDTIDNIQDASFLTPRNAPKWTVGAGGSVSYPVWRGYVEAYVKYDWVDEVETSLLNISIGRLDPRENLMASISYVFEEKYSLTVFGRNLTEEQYEIPTIIQPLFASGTTVPGRTWGIELTAEL